MQFLSQQPWNVNNLKPVRLLVAFLFMTLCVTSRGPLHADSPREAARLMESGQFGQAMEAYQALSLKYPRDARYPYNAGVAAYRAKLYDQAQEYFDAASLAQDLQLQQQAFYNRGNSLFKAGEQEQDFQKKTQHWREALSQYENALELNDEDPQAADNLQFVKRALEELKPSIDAMRSAYEEMMAKLQAELAIPLPRAMPRG